MSSDSALSSRMRLEDGRDVHIPLIDFDCSCSSRNLRYIAQALNVLDKTGGVILSSGQSYHYYGNSLLTLDEWPVYVARCFLLAPPVDARYLAHSLIEGEFSLRVSHHPSSCELPRVVGVIDPQQLG